MQRKQKKEKTPWYFYGIPINKETLFKALCALAIFVAIYILVETIEGKGLAGFSLLFLFFSAWYHHRAKLDDTQNLYRKVAWIAEKEPSGKFPGQAVSLRALELIDYIEIEQNKQNTPEQFRIDFSNETEKGNLMEILNAHKEHVLESYFCDWLPKSQNIYKLNDLEYYLVSLHSFVSSNLGEYKVSEAYSNREYISDYQFKCSLSDYGRVYYKLYLTTQLYIENNKNTNKVYNYIDEKKKELIMEILEKNETIFLSYKP